MHFITGDKIEAEVLDVNKSTQFHFRYDPVADTVYVGVRTSCGRFMDDVARVLEPYSDNPCIRTNGPIGFDAITTIMGTIREVYHNDDF